MIVIYNYKYIYLNNEKTKYIITEYGDIFNSLTDHKMTLQLNKDGYYIVRLTHNGETNTFVVHRLVAETFIPNPENKEEVHHINRVRTDNRVTNLMWCTRKEHFEIEREDFGKFVRSKGENHGSAKYSDETIRQAALDLSSGISRKDVSRKYSIDMNTLYRIYNKISWTYLTEDIEFPKLKKQINDNYSNELKDNILNLLNDGYSPKDIAKELDLDYTKKLRNYIKTMKRRKIKNKKGSTTIESNEDMYNIHINL